MATYESAKEKLLSSTENLVMCASIDHIMVNTIFIKHAKINTLHYYTKNEENNDIIRKRYSLEYGENTPLEWLDLMEDRIAPHLNKWEIVPKDDFIKFAKEKLLQYSENEENTVNKYVSEYPGVYTLVQAVEKADRNKLLYLYREKWLHQDLVEEDSQHCYFKHACIENANLQEIALYSGYLDKNGNMIHDKLTDTLTVEDILAKDWRLVGNNDITSVTKNAVALATEEISSKQQSLSWLDAITLIKKHKRVSRKAYDKKDNRIFEKFINLSPNGEGLFILICVPNYIHMINGIYSGNVYIPTKDDMAANDWYEVTDDDIAAINCYHYSYSSTIDADGDILLF